MNLDLLHRHKDSPSVPHQSNPETSPSGSDNEPPHDNRKSAWDRFPKRPAAIAAVGGLALTGAVLLGKSMGNNNNAAPSHETTQTVPVTPPAETIPTVPTTPSATETTQNPTETSMSPELVAEIDGESYADFAERPPEEQIEYGVAKLKLLSDEAYLYDFVDQKTTNGNSLANYNVNDVPINKTAGTEVPIYNLYANQIAIAWKKQNPKPDDGASLAERGNGALDTVMGKKLASIYAFPGTKDHADFIDTIKHSNAAVRLKDTVVFPYATDSESTVPGMEDGIGELRTLNLKYNGELLEGRDYIVKTSAGKKRITYAYIPLDDKGHILPVRTATNPAK